jgi:hypothetical protein
MARVCFFAILAFIFSGCAHFHHKTSPAVNEIVPMRQIGPFTHVYVTGMIDVTLHTQSARPSVLLYGDPRDTAEVSWTVLDGVLRVDLGNGFPKYGPVRVDISSRYLTSFSYKGVGSVNGQHLQSNLLDLTLSNAGKTHLAGKMVVRKLNITGPGVTVLDGVYSRQLVVKLKDQAHVQLNGVANIASVNVGGEGWFSLHWVKSHLLTIRGKDAAFIQLAGMADVLDVELWGKARFNGRYLRGTRTFVKTHDNSEADIATVKRQHTLANDASNIYFYNLPDMKADFMGLNGSVLDMRDCSSLIYKEPTPYNHVWP